MISLNNKINNYKEDDYQQYASNDSGLSCNSNGGTESDLKVSHTDFHCDDLTKSLFMNSFGGNELIQDDDIYSYKNKMDIGGIFTNKFRNFNLPKTENFNFKNASTFSSIIHDVENLKLLEPIYSPRTISNISCRKEGPLTSLMNPSSKIADDTKYDTKNDSVEKSRTKRPLKKNTTQEYLSSSIKDYKGDKALNDIVTFIQGSKKQSKTRQSKKNKTKSPSTKVAECPKLAKLDLIVNADSEAITEKTAEQSHCNVDVDSGTQSSQFVSLNNSDEDSIHVFVEDFQQVVSKKQKKTTTKTESSSNSKQNTVSNINCNLSNEVLSSRVKKSGKYKVKRLSNSILLSKESLEGFLAHQYSIFSQKYNTFS